MNKYIKSIRFLSLFSKEKIAVSIYLFYTLSAYGFSIPKEPDESDKWFIEMSESIDQLSSIKSSDDAIKELGSYIAKFSRSPRHGDSRWHDTMRKSQRAIITMENHAEFFALQVENARREQENMPRDNQIRYDRARFYNLVEVLGNIPSPQAVAVLGRYLDDEKDYPPTRRFLPENAFLASYALSKMELRDPPVPPLPYFAKYLENWQDALPQHREWFNEVKNGRKTFSFVGEPVAYRMLPDGSFETISIDVTDTPNDESVVVEKETTHQKTAVEKSTPTSVDKSIRWPWVIAGILLLSLCGFWIRQKRSA